MVEGKVTLVPAIVALLGDIPPPMKIGITSVTMNSESIKNIDDLKMAWIPFYLNKEYVITTIMQL